MRFNEHGEELPDPTPVEVPAGFKEPESMQQLIARLVRTHVSAAAQRHGFESVDEANDFEVEDEEFPETKYEVLGDERLEETHRAIVDSRAAKAAIERRKNRGTRRNAAPPRNASGSEQNVNTDVPSGSDVRPVGERGSPGDRHMGTGRRNTGGSGEDL